MVFNMALAMMTIQLVALLVAGLVAYYFSRPSRALWETILSLILGVPAGLIAGVVVALIFIDINDVISGQTHLRMFSYAFWFSIFGAILAIILTIIYRCIRSLYYFTTKEQPLQPQRQYPRWLAHLRKRASRLIYSFLPFAALSLFVFEISEVTVESFGFIIIVCVVLTAITYVLLTVVVRIASVWREPSGRMTRLWCFGSAYWIAGVFIFVLLFEPYDYSNLSEMVMDEYIHMFMVMLLPPLLIGSAIYVYDKFIREEDRPQTISAGKAEFDLPEDPIKKTITVEQMTTQPGIIVLERQQQKVWSLGKVMSFCLIISVAIIYFYWGKIQDYSGPTGAQLEVERQRVVEEKLEEMRKLAEDDGMATIQSGPVMGRYTEAITEVMRRKGEKEKLLRQRSRDVVDAGEYESWRKRYKEFLYKMEQYDHAITEEVSKGHVQTAEALYLPEWERQQQEEDRRKADEKKARAELDKLFKEHEINWYDWHSP